MVFLSNLFVQTIEENWYEVGDRVTQEFFFSTNLIWHTREWRNTDDRCYQSSGWASFDEFTNGWSTYVTFIVYRAETKMIWWQRVAEKVESDNASVSSSRFDFEVKKTISADSPVNIRTLCTPFSYLFHRTHLIPSVPPALIDLTEYTSFDCYLFGYAVC